MSTYHKSLELHAARNPYNGYTDGKPSQDRFQGQQGKAHPNWILDLVVAPNRQPVFLVPQLLWLSKYLKAKNIDAQL